MSRFFLLSLLFFAGCPMDNKQQKESHAITSEAKVEREATKRADWSQIEIDTEKAATEVTDDNLFGKFYEDRIEFHIIDDPDMQLHEAQVQQITLYYIDGLLCRKKYLLNKDIANHLAAKYGALTYRSLNYATDSLAKEMGILLASSSGKQFNPYLKKYQLRWDLDDTIIYFQHLEDSLETSNYYIEEVAEYRERYRSVQKDLL